MRLRRRPKAKFHRLPLNQTSILNSKKTCRVSKALSSKVKQVMLEITRVLRWSKTEMASKSLVEMMLATSFKLSNEVQAHLNGS